MAVNINKLLRHPAYKTIISNVFSLSGFQAANTIIPLLVIPYVVRIIGPGYFGIVSIAQAIVSYFVLFVNYGFDFTVSRKISIEKSNKQKIAEIFWITFFSKMLLFAVSSVIFLGVIILFKDSQEYVIVLYISYGIVLGNLLLPAWLFQGLERLGALAVFNFVIKLIFAFGVFFYLESAEQFYIYALMLSIGQIIVGGISFIFGIAIIGVKFSVPPFNIIIEYMKEGWNVFFSTALINVYTLSNTLILGLFASQENVGYFSSGFRIILAINALILLPINQSLYAQSARIHLLEVTTVTQYIKKILFIVLIITFPISLAIFIFAPTLVHIILGSQFESSILVIRVLSFFPIIIGCSNIMGLQGLLGRKLDKEFLSVIGMGAAMNLVLNVILDPFYAEIGSSISWLVTEIYITCGMFYQLYRNDIRILDLSFIKFSKVKQR